MYNCHSRDVDAGVNRPSINRFVVTCLYSLRVARPIWLALHGYANKLESTGVLAGFQVSGCGRYNFPC